jgi:prevent-host-death family protein
MNVMPISKFKATCLAVIEDVRRTGKPVRITRFGKPVAEVVPSRPAKRASWLGCMAGSLEIHGDIVGPIGAFDNWTGEQK